MSRLLYLIGASAVRHPWRVIGLWLAATAVVIGLASAVGGVLSDTFTIPGTSSQRATDLLRERFPAMSGADARVVAHVQRGTVDQARLGETAASLRELPGVSTVSPPVVSEDGRTAVIPVQYDVPVTDFAGTEGLDALEAAAEPLRQAGHQVEFGGQVPENVGAPSGRAELIGIAAALVILLLAFGAVIAAGLPLAIAAIGLAAGTAGIGLLAAVTHVSTVAPTLATMVGLGVGIDYALFIVTRHRDGLAQGLSVPEAAARANATAGKSVAFAGATVLLALSGLQLTGIPDFATMGYATGIVVLVTVLAAVTLLPALLGLVGLRVYSRRDRRAGRREAAASHSRMAARLAQLVGRRPVAWLAGSVVVLVALAAPALGLKIGESDAGNEATSTTVRQAYDLTANAFGPGANGPLLIAVDIEKIGGAAQLAGLAADVAATPDVRAVTPPVLSPDGTAAVLTVTPQTGPQHDRTVQLVRDLNSDVLPDGAQIAGFTAAVIDLSDVMAGNLWLVIAAVIAASFVLLTVAFRSVVVPIKAAAVNLLSIGAAYGVLALVFQTETGARLVGLPGEVPIAAYVPVLMFAILFGLSMDYEVFLLSRVREEFLRTGDSRGSVVSGLASTARVITSAAVIMVAVFLGFAFDPNVAVKMVGIGLAAAIAVDATLIRLVVVPAAMALLGDANWYFPRWLDRLLSTRAPRGATPAADLPGPDREPEPVGIH